MTKTVTNTIQCTRLQIQQLCHQIIPRWNWTSLTSTVLDFLCRASWHEAVTTLSMKSSAICISSCDNEYQPSCNVTVTTLDIQTSLNSADNGYELFLKKRTKSHICCTLKSKLTFTSWILHKLRLNDIAPLPFTLWMTWLGIRKSFWPWSGARCKWFAYGPADATATPSSLASLKSRFV